MFLLNSCLGRFSAAALTALLLPKLRSHFAEFLNNTSPVGLRILSSSTCVGFRYGPSMSHSGFSRQEAPALRYFFSLRVTALPCGTVFPAPQLLRLHRSCHSRLAFASRVPASSVIQGCRNVNLLSIGYSSQPLLRPRLSQGRSALPWKPWIFGLGDSHPHLATHSGILSPYKSTCPPGQASLP